MTMSLDEKQSQITGTHECGDDVHNKRSALSRNETKYNEYSERVTKRKRMKRMVYTIRVCLCMHIACCVYFWFVYSAQTQATSEEHSQRRSCISLVVRLIHILNFCFDYFFFLLNTLHFSSHFLRRIFGWFFFYFQNCTFLFTQWNAL